MDVAHLDFHLPARPTTSLVFDSGNNPSISPINILGELADRSIEPILRDFNTAFGNFERLRVCGSDVLGSAKVFSSYLFMIKINSCSYIIKS